MVSKKKTVITYLKHARLPLLLLLIALSCSCCTTKKHLIYMQGMDEERIVMQTIAPKDYQIQTNDNLYIKVLGIDDLTSSVFNLSEGQSYVNSDAAIELSSYTVASDGTIDFPYIGKVDVRSKTIPEIKTLMQSKIDPYLEQNSVVVKLVNKKITVIGEVTRPGQYSISKENITIFEALGYAGDITDYGNRKNLRIIRDTPEGKVICRVDLTQKKLLTSEFYYLMPNDVVYVEPDSKVFGKKGLSFTVLFTAISSAILVYNSFIN